MANLNVSAYFADGRTVTVSGELPDEVVSGFLAPLIVAIADAPQPGTTPPAGEGDPVSTPDL